MEGIIYKKMADVLADTMPVEKNGYNQSQGFKFRSIDDTVASVRKSLIKHNVAILPEVLSVEKSTYQTSKGSTMNVSDVLVAYRFVAEDGSSVETTMAGQAADSGDKAVSKSLSMAFKYMMFQTFLCGTDGDPDAEIVEAQASALTKVQKLDIAALGLAVGLADQALLDYLSTVTGRVIASAGDLVADDYQPVKEALTQEASK